MPVLALCRPVFAHQMPVLQNNRKVAGYRRNQRRLRTNFRLPTVISPPKACYDALFSKNSLLSGLRDQFAHDCAHHHPVLANRVFPAQRQIGRFWGDFRPLISRIFVSVSAHPFRRRYLGACLCIQKFRSRRPGSGTKSGRIPRFAPR
jgi:hypothetical protein